MCIYVYIHMCIHVCRSFFNFFFDGSGCLSQVKVTGGRRSRCRENQSMHSKRWRDAEVRRDASSTNYFKLVQWRRCAEVCGRFSYLRIPPHTTSHLQHFSSTLRTPPHTSSISPISAKLCSAHLRTPPHTTSHTPPHSSAYLGTSPHTSTQRRHFNHIKAQNFAPRPPHTSAYQRTPAEISANPRTARCGWGGETEEVCGDLWRCRRTLSLISNPPPSIKTRGGVLASTPPPHILSL